MRLLDFEKISCHRKPRLGLIKAVGVRATRQEITRTFRPGITTATVSQGHHNESATGPADGAAEGKEDRCLLRRTGNEYGEDDLNVIKLYEELKLVPDKQVAYYHPGVGTWERRMRSQPAERHGLVSRGLAFGYQVSENVADAFQYLIRTYEPEEQVFVFGFSQRAYTARALCGMLRCSDRYRWVMRP